MRKKQGTVVIGVSKTCGCILNHRLETLDFNGKPDAESKKFESDLKKQGLKSQRKTEDAFDKTVRGCKLCLQPHECRQDPTPLFPTVMK